MPKSMTLNRFQKAVLKDYADGDFKHLAEAGFIEDVHALGDTLLTFMLIELSDSEGCEDESTACSRMRTARDEIDVAIEALLAINTLMIEKAKP